MSQVSVTAPLSRVATIDIGTNSVLLLVAARDGQHIRALSELAAVTRLGEGVDASGELSPAAQSRTLAVLEQYAAEIAKWNVDAVAAVGTSAMRDARGGTEFSERAAAILGVRPTVISGEREAQLTLMEPCSGSSPRGCSPSSTSAAGAPSSSSERGSGAAGAPLHAQ